MNTKELLIDICEKNKKIILEKINKVSDSNLKTRVVNYINRINFEKMIEQTLDSTENDYKMSLFFLKLFWEDIRNDLNCFYEEWKNKQNI